MREQSQRILDAAGEMGIRADIAPTLNNRILHHLLAAKGISDALAEHTAGQSHEHFDGLSCCIDELIDGANESIEAVRSGGMAWPDDESVPPCEPTVIECVWHDDGRWTAGVPSIGLVSNREFRRRELALADILVDLDEYLCTHHTSAPCCYVTRTYPHTTDCPTDCSASCAQAEVRTCSVGKTKTA